MKSLHLFIVFGLLVHIAIAQESPKPSIKTKNNLYAANDLGAWALNYERIVYQKNRRQIGVKVGGLIDYTHIDIYGLSFLPKETFWGWGTSIGGFYLLSRPSLKNHWEFGLHASFLKRDNPGGEVRANTITQQLTYDGRYCYDTYNIYVFSRIAFRHQKPNGGLFYKAGVNLVPFGSFYNDDKVRLENRGWHSGFGLFPWPDLGLGWTF